MHAEVLICGAGIAGVATAYHLAVRHKVKGVMLVDERSPLSLTSDKSTECYRNWWPGPEHSMVRMMGRSIDLLEEFAETSGNVFHLNRRGYVFATTSQDQIERYRQAGHIAAGYGAGPLRVHPGDHAYHPSLPDGYRDHPTGADLILDQKIIAAHFPYLSPKTTALLHIRRAGWLSAQQLGAFLLEEAQKAGVEVLQDRVEAVGVRANQVQSVHLASAGQVATRTFVNAAGPLLRPVGDLIGVPLPVYSELHQKVAFRDHQNALPRDAPMLIWGDRQQLIWDEDERELLADSADMGWLLDTFPAGVHTRPEGGGESQIVLLLWEYTTQAVEPEFPIRTDPLYPEIALRGIAAMIPGMQVYLNRLPKPVLDGGYYTKTQENRPLAGPLPVAGAFVLGALSGFGIMSAPALGELVAAHITGDMLPDYAPAFALDRYQDADYLSLLKNWGDSWQL